jgi:hypothetical protein
MNVRRKGHDWERRVRNRFAMVFGPDHVRRGLQYRDGAECPDVITPRFWVECKAGRLTNPRAALRQATRDAEGSGRWPIAVCKDDGDKPHVTMDLEDFLDLISEWHALRATVQGTTH